MRELEYDINYWKVSEKALKRLLGIAPEYTVSGVEYDGETLTLRLVKVRLRPMKKIG